MIEKDQRFFILMLGLNETIDQIPMSKSVC